MPATTLNTPRASQPAAAPTSPSPLSPSDGMKTWRALLIAREVEKLKALLPPDQFQQIAAVIEARLLAA